MNYLFKITKEIRRFVIFCVAGVGLVACTPAPTPVGFADPFEAQNRKTHAASRAFDKAIIRPAATGYGKTVPGPVRKGISNVSANLSLPGTVVNNLLQFRIEEAGANTFRFLINSTFGMAGLLDVATEAGIAQDPSDFGETLYVWGVKEGAYIQLPLLGPSTARAAAGRVVDLATNPLRYVLQGQDAAAVAGSSVLARVGDRYEYSDLVDSVLYDSEDSYAQARLLYLQSRRFKLSGETQLDESDPYEDVYGTE